MAGTKEKSKEREDKYRPRLIEEEKNPRSSKTWFGMPHPQEDEDGDPEDME